MTRGRIIASAIGLILLVGIIWLLASFGLVSASGSSTSITLSSRTSSFTKTLSGIAIVRSGAYVATTTNGTVKAQAAITVHGAWWTRVKFAPQTSSELAAHPLFDRSATDIQQVDGGYLYINTARDSLEFIDRSGTLSDLSDNLTLSTTPPDNTSGTAANNHLMLLARIDSTNFVAITTHQIFVIHDANGNFGYTPYTSGLSRLISANIGFQAVTQDATTPGIFYVGTTDNTIYRIDATNPASPSTKQLFIVTRGYNHLLGGGGKVIIYSDRAMSTSAAAVANIFNKTEIVEPQVYDATTGKLKKTLGTGPIVAASISPNGTYLSYRKKLSTTVEIAKLSNFGSVASLPVGDSLASVWSSDGTSFYYQRDAELWEAGASDHFKVAYSVGKTPAIAAALTATSAGIVATDDTGSSVVFTGAALTSQEQACLTSLPHAETTYRVECSASMNGIVIYAYVDPFNPTNQADGLANAKIYLASVGLGNLPMLTETLDQGVYYEYFGSTSNND